MDIGLILDAKAKFFKIIRDEIQNKVCTTPHKNVKQLLTTTTAITIERKLNPNSYFGTHWSLITSKDTDKLEICDIETGNEKGIVEKLFWACPAHTTKTTTTTTKTTDHEIERGTPITLQIWNLGQGAVNK